MLKAHADTAVVVLSYNGKHLHNDFFPQLLDEAQNRYEVFLIDNASTDGTADYVQSHFPQVRIISIDVNFGFANGYYLGLQQIEADYYVLLSADFEITSNWFQPLRRCFDTHPKLAALQPKIKYYKDKSMFEYAGAGGGFIDRWGYLFCRGRVFFTLEADEQQYNNNIETFWAGGGCMFVNARIYHQLGGLDKDLYAHMEEVDLCWRMKNAGYRVGYCGESTVYHIGGSVISYGSPQKIFYNYRNSLILLLKNLPASRLIWLLPFRLLLDGVSGLRALLKGDGKEVVAIFKAHMSFYANLPMWLKKRKVSRSFVTQPNLTGVYPKSLIWQYFIKKKTRFSDLEWPEIPL